MLFICFWLEAGVCLSRKNNVSHSQLVRATGQVTFINILWSDAPTTQHEVLHAAVAETKEWKINFNLNALTEEDAPIILGEHSSAYFSILFRTKRPNRLDTYRIMRACLCVTMK